MQKLPEIYLEKIFADKITSLGKTKSKEKR